MARKDIVITEELKKIAARANPAFTKDELNEMQACVKIARPEDYYFVDPFLALQQRKKEIKKLKESPDKRERLKYRYINRLLKDNNCDIIYKLNLQDEDGYEYKLYRLKVAIDKALSNCQQIISTHPNAILSEADLERVLSNNLEKVLRIKIGETPKPNQYSVHTQISHYPNEEENSQKHLPNMRPDILLLDESNLEYAPDINKKFKYYKEAFSIELKYFHKYIIAEKLNEDIGKRNRLERNTWLYVVVLVDSENEMDFQEKERKILESVPHRSKANLYCKVLKKVTSSHAAENFVSYFEKGKPKKGKNNTGTRKNTKRNRP